MIATPSNCWKSLKIYVLRNIRNNILAKIKALGIVIIIYIKKNAIFLQWVISSQVLRIVIARSMDAVQRPNGGGVEKI